MALTVEQFSIGIRATTAAPTGNILADMTRLLAFVNAAIDKHAMTAPEAVKDVAAIQLGQYLYDAPVGVRAGTANALRESGASALLSPYRVHRIGVDGAVAGALAGLDEDAVTALIRAIVPAWALMPNAPVGGAGLTAGEMLILRKAALIDAISLSDRDLDFASDDGTTKTLELPGISVYDEGTLVGTANAIEQIRFLGTGVSVTGIGGVRADVSVTGGSGGSGLTQAQVDGRIRLLARLVANKIARADLDANQQLPAYSSANVGQFLRVMAGGAGLEFGAIPARGLNQTEVNALIAAMVKAYARTGGASIQGADLASNQRLPAPSAGMFLKWNSGATALENTDAPSGGGLTGTQVDARVAPFARANALKDVGIEKAQDTFDAFDGGGWENVADAGAQPATHPYVRETILTQQFTASNIVTGTYGQVYVGGPHIATAYIGVRVPKSYITPIDKLALYIGSDTYNTDDPGNARYTLDDDADVTLITSNATYNYYSIGPVNKPAGDHYRVQGNLPFELDRSRIADGDTLVPLGQDGQLLGHAGGKPAWEDKPARHVQQFTETFPSFELVRSDADKLDSAASYFSPTFDLDDAGNSRGEFHLSLELRIEPVSDVNMGFESGKANQTDADRRRALTSIVFASDLAEEDDWSITTDDTRDNGIQAFSITVYSGATIAGHYRLSVIHNANNEVGVWTWYEGEAGATGFTIYAELRVSFEATDAPAAPEAAGGLTFTEIASTTTTGQLSSNSTPGFSAFSSTDQAAIIAAKQDASVLAFYVVVTRGGQFHKTAMVWKPPGETSVNAYMSGIMGNLGIPTNASYGVVYFTAGAAMSIIRSDAGFYWRRGDTLKVYKVT